ncbi:MAG TPA: hypothetical protein VIY72_03395, partial [Acidimicrobiales bacterium]
MVDDMADTAGCAEARDDLELLALDALEPDRAAAVGRHVQQCASCAAELVRLESVVGSVLHAARSVEPGAELTERILGGRTTPERAAEVDDEVDDRSAAPPPSIARRPRRRGRVAAGAVGAAAAALLFGVLVGVLVG